MKDKLIEALKQLDTTNDEHWTQDGLPRLDVLKNIVGENVTRSDIFKVCKSFNRFNPEVIVNEEVEETTEVTTEDGGGDGTEDGGETEATNVVTAPNEQEFASEAEKAEAELVAARLDLATAQNRFKVAQERADGFRQQIAKERSEVPLHIQVQRFQQSQNEQRAKTSAQVNALRKVASALSPEEAASLKSGLGDIL